MSEPTLTGAQMTLPELGPALRDVTAAAVTAFTPLDEAAWRTPPAPGKWSRLEELGHLIDSANNNHARFVRALAQERLDWPGYAQEDLVRVQHFRDAPTWLLMDLWCSYNHFLAFLIEQIPPAKALTRCGIGGSADITLEELALDYVAHMEHHLRHMLPGVTTIPYTGMPWPPPNRWIDVTPATTNSPPVYR